VTRASSAQQALAADAAGGIIEPPRRLKRGRWADRFDMLNSFGVLGDVPSPVENQRRLSEVIFSDRTFLNTF